MAAANTATSSGTHKAVVRSTGTACKPRDSAKSNAVTMYQRKRLVTRKAEESQGDRHNFGVKAEAKRQQLQEHRHDLDGQRPVTSNHEVKRGISPSRLKECLQQVQKVDQQSKEQELLASEPVKRRRRRCGLLADQGLQPSRVQGCEANVAIELPNTRGSKRSSRLLAKELAIKEPTPAPLRLPKLQVVLTRKEIHDDWLKITGQRYVGKPKKSALNQLGLGLCTSLMCPSSISYLNSLESKP